MKIGPLQVVSHVVQKHLAGEQETHWGKTNKELSTSSKMVIFFVCLVPVRFLPTSKVLLYHVTGHLQSVHFPVTGFVSLLYISFSNDAS